MVKRALALFLVLTLNGGCATPRGASGALPDLKPGERPAADTDEAGLWMVMDRYERELKTSGLLVRDPALNAYLQSVVCKLAAAYCRSIRIYLIATPTVNASMAPNGVMQVWTGLLLRAGSEDQLASVLGHEIGHYARRHTLQQWRDLRAKATVAQMLAVLGPVGLVGQIAIFGSVLAFSRDEEREADEIGFALMTGAGYDPKEPARIWEALEEERKAADRSSTSVFFATHPTTAERIETLRALGAKANAPVAPADQSRFRDATLRHRAAWLRDELRGREFKGSQVVLDHLRSSGLRPGEIEYFQGELYRLRAEKGDDAKALAAYQRALVAGDAPPETYRMLGLLLMKAGDRDRARGAFERYLEACPGADDHEIVRDYIGQLQ